MTIDLNFDVSNFPWPDGTKKLFEAGGNNPDTAFIHPTERNWANYARGYQAAYERVFESWDTHGIKTDPIIYPLAYLCRQYLELSLKDLIQKCEKLLLKPKEKKRKNHNIEGLWKKVRPLIREVWEDDPEETLDYVERLILEFAAVDEESFAFRYPTNVEGDLVHLPDIASLDVIALREAMKQLSAFFDAVSGSASDYLSQRNEEW